MTTRILAIALKFYVVFPHWQKRKKKTFNKRALAKDILLAVRGLSQQQIFCCNRPIHFPLSPNSASLKDVCGAPYHLFI